jgi:hypothetical protein
MEEQPSFEPQQSQEQTPGQGRLPDFVRRLGRVLLISLVGAVLYALVFGPQDRVGFANGLFWVGTILLMIALIPTLGDMFGRSTVVFRDEDLSFDEIVQETRGRSRKSETGTFLYGLGGAIVIVLSLIVGFV